MVGSRELLPFVIMGSGGDGDGAVADAGGGSDEIPSPEGKAYRIIYPIV